MDAVLDDKNDGLLGRVVRVDRGFAIARLRGEEQRLSGGGFAVGDYVKQQSPGQWVVQPRTSVLTRQMADRSSREQVLAANIDVVAIVEPAVPAPNLRRIERMLALAWSSGATPVVVITKADLLTDGGATQVREVESAALGVTILTFSSISGHGADRLLDLLGGDCTFALLGPSGAGKSSLVNYLSGTATMNTGSVRTDGTGRHVTTHRQLTEIPGVGAIIDTPGIRAVGLTVAEVDIFATFSEVVEQSQFCRFSDCSHTVEPGCGLTSAVAEGVLSADRVASFLRLLAEASAQQSRRTTRDRREERVDTRGRALAKRTAMRAKGRR